ncbi:MAG TPA: hypothetical protein VFO08_20655 [Methylomirabilota bacterium]|nr:hypothetical protein [Methylomirabilota bacterium]
MGRLIVRFGTALFCLFMGGALFFLLTIETTFNGGFVLSVKLLCLPLAMIVFGFTYLNREMLQARSRRPWYVWVMAAVLYPMMLLFAWPYVLAANALLPTKGRIEFRGPIVEKFMSGGRYTSCHVRIRDVGTEQNVELNVGCRAYATLAVGALYSSCFERGRLGIPVRWRFAEIPNPCLPTTGRAADAPAG